MSINDKITVYYFYHHSLLIGVFFCKHILRMFICYALFGFHKKAYDYQLQSQSAQDSIYNIEKSRIISEMEMRFNTNRKESQIADLEKDNELKTCFKVFIQYYHKNNICLRL